MRTMTVEGLRELLYRDEDDHDADLEQAMDAALPWIRFLREVLEGAPGDWAQDAACRRSTADMFPTRGQSAQPALDICEWCVVRYECENWALNYGPTLHGIAGGLSQRGRRNLAAEAAATPDAA